MESTDPTAVAASRTTNTHIQYGNRLKIRVYVRGDELELTDERIDNREAPINVQGIISAFTEVLKINPNTIPIDTRSIAENPNDSGFSTQKPEFKTEIMRLRQLAQKFEGEVMNLRQLLQESKEENEQLKIRFRSATHMKAAELAQQFSRLHSVQSAADGRETEGIPGLVEPFTPEQKPTEFILNSKVKEIDFFNLDDILGKDNAVCVPSKRKAEDVSEEDDNAVTNNSGSGSGTISSDDEKYLGGLSTKTFVLPQATPPSVLKIGLHVDHARAGGDCMVENTHGSPLRRSPGRRGRSNNDDSRAEREFFIQTDKDLASLKDGFRSMVEDFGIMYKPEKKDHSNYKAVHIGNLPEDIDYHKLLAKVRGGKIVSATICNTIKIRGCGRRMSALVVFVNAESARAYVQFSNKNGIYFDSQKAVVGLVDTPTYPLSLPAERRIGHGQNRCLMIKKLRSELSLARIDRVINVGVNKYRVDAMERLWKDEKGDVRIRFASISAASMAYWRLRTDPNYDRLEIIFEDDPCRRPLSDLLPPLKGRRVSDFAEMKVNYDDKDDSGVENTQEISPLNQPIRSKVNNADEIELEDDEEDTVDHKFTEGKTDTKKRVSDKAKTADGANNANDSNTSEAMAAEMATIANGEGIQVEDSQKIQEPRIPNISKTEPPTSTKDIPRPEDFPKVEDSHTAEDFTLLESVTFSPIPHLSSSVSDESSSITTVILTAADGGVESWADVVNEAVEAGGLEPPVELNPVLTPTTLIDTDGEPLNQVIRFLPSIIEEDLLTCEPVEEPVTEAVMETLVAGFPITELPVTKALVVEALVRETSVKQSSTTTAPMKQSSAKTSPVEAFRKPAVKLPSSTHTMIPDKFDLAGTDLDPVLLPRYVFEKVLSNSPRKGLSSSRWAHPATNATAPIIIEAPLAVPVLGTAAKSTSEPIATTGPLAKPVPQPASLVPANAPKGPRAGVPTSRWVNPESSHKSLVRDQLARIQKSLPAQAAAEPNAIEPSTALAPKPTSTGPKFMSCKRQNSASSSRYSSLDLDTSCPRSSLRNFYSAVDLQTAAPEKLGVAVFEAAVSGAADLGPVTPDTAKSVPTTPEAGQHARPRGKTGPESGVETKSGIETKPRVEIQSGVETQSGIMVTT